MKRKLPSDSEVWALHAAGLTYSEIAIRHCCAIGSVQDAMDRWNAKPSTQKTMVKASTPDPSFVRVGHDPIHHRQLADDRAGLTLAMDAVYRRSNLELHECADLLREWGVA